MSPVAAPGAARLRLDELLVERGLAATRAEAARLVLAGRVRLPGGATAKPGLPVARDVPLELVEAPPYVSRGGEKLAAALDALAVGVAGRVCLDVGASTGGFTDCLLGRGARRVYAVDVGHGQLHARLRADPRVVALEGVNARYLDAARFAEPPTLATVDVAFIALAKVLPAIARCLADPVEIVALVKPQFEVGRHRVGKGGVVRDPALHREAVRSATAAASALGLAVGGVVASPLRGPKGNREFFVLAARDLGGRAALEGARLEAALEAAVAPPGRPGDGERGGGPAAPARSEGAPGR
jgi:23S rRNA (cytidine1920-2'-O)/16S rRNA (cytidine1409-2'-O)-methyltransferase